MTAVTAIELEGHGPPSLSLFLNVVIMGLMSNENSGITQHCGLLALRTLGLQSHSFPEFKLSFKCKDRVAQTGGGEVGKVAQSIACISVTIP